MHPIYLWSLCSNSISNGFGVVVDFCLVRIGISNEAENREMKYMNKVQQITGLVANQQSRIVCSTNAEINSMINNFRMWSCASESKQVDGTVEQSKVFKRENKAKDQRNPIIIKRKRKRKCVLTLPLFPCTYTICV